MTRTRRKRAATISLLMLVMLIAVQVGLTWRMVRQDRLNRALIAAVKRNDDKAVVSLLNQGADANCRDKPPRKFALLETLMQVVRGRRPQASYGPTPLLIALEPREIPPNAPDVEAFPPENLRLVRVLLNHGAQVNQTDEGGVPPLCWAIDGGKNATARLLLARGASVQRNAVLTYAAGSALIEKDLVADLLDRGADVNEQPDPDGDTPLWSAVDARRVEVVRLLLARHADVNRVSRGLTPLDHAYYDSTPESRKIMRLLKAAGAKR